MINFNMNEPNLRKAMGVTDADIDKAIKIFVDTKDVDNKKMSWLIQRIWIDETLNDNLKCFLLFHMGVLWEKYNKDTNGELPPWYKGKF
jgi:hypothetical protein